MAKRPLKRARGKPAAKKPRPSRPEVSRYEYAQLCMQLGVVESQVRRHRIDLDIQLRRIAQLQDELDTFKKTQAGTTPTDSLLIPLPKPSIES